MQSFAELGQKMFDVQQRGIKGCPKKVQLGVNQVGLVVFDVKGRPTGSSILLMTMKDWCKDAKSEGVEITLKPPKGSKKEDGGVIRVKTGEADELVARLNLVKKELSAVEATTPR